MTQKRRRAIRGSGEQLRAEIIDATKKLLATSARADDVSIRAVADAVGVTSPSIYLHFADKNDLLGAVVVDVFQALDDAMIATAQAASEPLDRLCAYGLAYIRFAVDHPEHYRIAMMDVTPTPQKAVDEVIRSAAFEHLHQAVVDCIDAEIFGGDPLPITFDLWSAAHGAASLLIAKPYLPWGSVDEFSMRVLSASAAGHVLTTRMEVASTPAALAEWTAAQQR